MNGSNKTSVFTSDADSFDQITAHIKRVLSDLQKVVDSINQMRVEASHMECDLMLVLNASSWENVASFIGHAPQQFIGYDMKSEE
ncbi:unnamed protein product [Leptosia nina]|uniref:Uncharacterized protein n=1 Tax=Leptosia nina TaxID=320188 RepID=A0AAV1J7S7_9NEOP